MIAEAAAGGGITTILYVVVAVIAIVGGGGIIQARQAAKRAGARDYKIDLVVHAVLGSRGAEGVEDHAGLIEEFRDLKVEVSGHGEQLDEIQHAISPNGRDTQSLGDIAARVEAAVAQLDSRVGGVDSKVARVDRRLTAYAGANRAEHRRFREEIDQLKEGK